MGKTPTPKSGSKPAPTSAEVEALKAEADRIAAEKAEADRAAAERAEADRAAALEAAAQSAEAERLAAEAAKAQRIPARILVDHGEHRCNSLALLTADEVAEAEGVWADTSADAVAYVKALDA